MSFGAPHFGVPPVDWQKTSRPSKNAETHLLASVCSISEAPSTYSLRSYSFCRHHQEQTSSIQLWWPVIIIHRLSPDYLSTAMAKFGRQSKQTDLTNTKTHALCPLVKKNINRWFLKKYFFDQHLSCHKNKSYKERGTKLMDTDLI